MSNEYTGVSGFWNRWMDALFKPASFYPLIGLRLAFGLAMAAWAIRMLFSGRVTELFAEPRFFFPYQGFEWIRPLPSPGMHFVFVLIGILALMIAAGWYFRISIVLFIALFCYISLIDKASYLSYYYFILVLSVMLLLSPAYRLFSLDQLRKPSIRADYVPNWCILAFKLQVVMVFYFAGMAKLNGEWLFAGRPVLIWLVEIVENIGIDSNFLIESRWIAIGLSWLLLIFDFIIPNFLLDSKTSVQAFKIVLLVQLLVEIFLPTGFFPVLIVLSCIIFLPADLIHSFISRVAYFLFDVFEFKDEVFQPGGTVLLQYRRKRLFPLTVAAFLFIQICVPVSLFLNWGSDRWADAAFDFSWDVRINEKQGVIRFFRLNPETAQEEQINLNSYLSKIQQKRMAEDPEMIRQFGSFLCNPGDGASQKGSVNVKAVSCVSLNGRKPDCKSFSTPELTGKNN